MFISVSTMGQAIAFIHHNCCQLRGTFHDSNGQWHPTSQWKKILRYCIGKWPLSTTYASHLYCVCSEKCLMLLGTIFGAWHTVSTKIVLECAVWQTSIGMLYITWQPLMDDSFWLKFEDICMYRGYINRCLVIWDYLVGGVWVKDSNFQIFIIMTVSYPELCNTRQETVVS